jgi:hypothetical protein
MRVQLQNYDIRFIQNPNTWQGLTKYAMVTTTTEYIKVHVTLELAIVITFLFITALRYFTPTVLRVN